MWYDCRFPEEIKRLMEKHMQKVVYIYGLGYSGSTVLGAMLGSHPEMVGLGEIFPSLSRAGRPIDFSSDTCSCGSKIDRCTFWSGLKKWHQDNYHKADYIRKFVHILDYVKERMGPDRIIVDSSKRPDIFRDLYLHLGDKVDFRVLFVLRDVRGFSVSAKVHRTERGRWGNMFLYQLGWWLKNRRYKSILDHIGVPHLQISYEGLIQKPEVVLKEIAEFVGVLFDQSMLKPDMLKNHIIQGNTKAIRLGKDLQYDNRWMDDNSAKRVYAALPFVARWNEQNVYASRSL